MTTYTNNGVRLHRMSNPSLLSAALNLLDNCSRESLQCFMELLNLNGIKFLRLPLIIMMITNQSEIIRYIYKNILSSLQSGLN